MTRQEMTAAYAKAYQNQLGAAAEKRMAELEAEADRMGLRFRMTNQKQYNNPHYLGAPRFELEAK